MFSKEQRAYLVFRSLLDMACTIWKFYHRLAKCFTEALSTCCEILIYFAIADNRSSAFYRNLRVPQLLTCNLCTVINTTISGLHGIYVYCREMLSLLLFFTFSLRFFCGSKNQNEPSELAVYCTLIKHTITANQSACYILVLL